MERHEYEQFAAAIANANEFHEWARLDRELRTRPDTATAEVHDLIRQLERKSAPFVALTVSRAMQAPVDRGYGEGEAPFYAFYRGVVERTGQNAQFSISDLAADGGMLGVMDLLQGELGERLMAHPGTPEYQAHRQAVCSARTPEALDAAMDAALDDPIMTNADLMMLERYCNDQRIVLDMYRMQHIEDTLGTDTLLDIHRAATDDEARDRERWGAQDRYGDGDEDMEEDEDIGMGDRPAIGGGVPLPPMGRAMDRVRDAMEVARAGEEVGGEMPEVPAEMSPALQERVASILGRLTTPEALNALNQEIPGFRGAVEALARRVAARTIGIDNDRRGFQP